MDTYAAQQEINKINIKSHGGFVVVNVQCLSIGYIVKHNFTLYLLTPSDGNQSQYKTLIYSHHK